MAHVTSPPAIRGAVEVTLQPTRPGSVMRTTEPIRVSGHQSRLFRYT